MAGQGSFVGPAENNPPDRLGRHSEAWLFCIGCCLITQVSAQIRSCTGAVRRAGLTSKRSSTKV